MTLQHRDNHSPPMCAALVNSGNQLKEYPPSFPSQQKNRFDEWTQGLVHIDHDRDQ